MNLRRTRRVLDFLAAGFGAAISDVVADGIIEQDGILRHDTDLAVQAGLGDRTQVLPVDADRAGVHVIKPEQQPPDGGFARARGADQRHPLSRRHPQREILQDLAIGFVAEVHMVKHDLAALDLQGLGIGRILDFGGLAQQAEHLAHIHQRLTDFAVDRAEKAQGQRDLHHIGVDHDEIANRELARLHAHRAHHHHQDQADGDDDILPDVQRRQRLAGHHRELLVRRHRLVVARGFPAFGVEIFDGFEIEQAVDGLLVRLGIAVVHLAADVHPPFGDLERVGDIDRDRDQHDHHVEPAEIDREDRGHQGQFQDQRPDGKQHEAQQEIDALDAAFDDAGQPAGLAGDVIAHRQAVDMGEGFQRQFAQGALTDADKDRIARLGKGRGAHPREAVSDGDADRAHAQPQHRVVASGARIDPQRIDRLLVHERHRDRDELGQQQEDHRQDDADLHPGLAFRPKIGSDAFHRGPAIGGTMVYLGFGGGGRGEFAHGTGPAKGAAAR